MTVTPVVHSSGTPRDMEQSLKEEQERRAKAERQAQLLKTPESGELASLNLMHYIWIACAQHVLNSY